MDKVENNINYRPSRNKAPVYTSDKRAKFTQRANKKWVRLATVFGYMIAVSMPAVILSVYYTCFWNPNYAEQFNKTDKQLERNRRDLTNNKNSQSPVHPIESPPTLAPSDAPVRPKKDTNEFPNYISHGQGIEPLVEPPGGQCLPCNCGNKIQDGVDTGEDIFTEGASRLQHSEKKPKLQEVIEQENKGGSE